MEPSEIPGWFIPFRTPLVSHLMLSFVDHD